MMTSSKPRVLFVGPYPPPFSGPDIAMKAFLESSLKERFDIVFVNTNRRKSNADRGKMDAAIGFAYLGFFSNLLQPFSAEDRNLSIILSLPQWQDGWDVTSGALSSQNCLSATWSST